MCRGELNLSNHRLMVDKLRLKVKANDGVGQMHKRVKVGVVKMIKVGQ